MVARHGRVIFWDKPSGAVLAGDPRHLQVGPDASIQSLASTVASSGRSDSTFLM